MEGTLKIGRKFLCWGGDRAGGKGVINVSRAGDPVHAGDKALTRETPMQRGGLTGMDMFHLS